MAIMNHKSASLPLDQIFSVFCKPILEGKISIIQHFGNVIMESQTRKTNKLRV